MARIAAVRTFPQPRLKCELLRFLGLINGHHRSLQPCDLIHYTLDNAIKESKLQKLVCTDYCRVTFSTAKNAIVHACILVHAPMHLRLTPQTAQALGVRALIFQDSPFCGDHCMR